MTKKYTNLQLDLIAQRITSEINKEINTHNETVKVSKMEEVELTLATDPIYHNLLELEKLNNEINTLNNAMEEVLSTISQLTAKLKDYNFNRYNRNYDNLITNHINFIIAKTTTLKLPIQKNTVLTEIILSDVDNLQELIDRIKEKFLNN